MFTSQQKYIGLVAPVLLILAISLLFVSSASAGVEGELECLNDGGSWSGENPFTGTCTYAPGVFPRPNDCSAEDTIVTTYVDGAWKGYTCVPPASSPSAPGFAQSGKCKLLSIENPLHIGTSFAASWIGRLEAIRFRQAGTAIIFVPPVAGTVHFENGHRAGDFLAFGLARGRWEATCWGVEGTFGTAKIVFVK